MNIYIKYNYNYDYDHESLRNREKIVNNIYFSISKPFFS